MPRWYVGFHGGDDRRSLNTIHVYATDGEAIGTALAGRGVPKHVPLRELRGFGVGPDGDLYVADRGADRVRRYDWTTGEPRGELGADRLRTPIHLLFRPDGALLVGSRDDDAIFACDPASGAIDVLVPAGAGGLREPAGMAFGTDGALYVASRGSRQILRYDAANGRPDPAPFVDGLADRPEFMRLVEGEG